MSDPYSIPQAEDGPGGTLPPRPFGVTLIAVLDLIGAVFAGLVGIGLAIATVVEALGAGTSSAPSSSVDVVVTAACAALFIGLAALYGFAGWGLLRLAPWGRTLQFIGSSIGLIAGCPGFIVNLCILVYMAQGSVGMAFSGKSLESMTPDERRILEGRASSPAVIIAVIAGLAVVLVAAIGITAAIAVPNLVSAIQRGKQKRTQGDLRTIGTAVEAYAVDHQQYPVTDDVATLERLLEPTYLAAMPTMDGWSHGFDVSVRADAYVLRSRGKDGRPDVPDPWDAADAPRETSGDDADIVYANGVFTRFPPDRRPSGTGSP